MNLIKTYAPLAARVMMGLLFLIAGLGKLGDVAGFTGYMTSAGVPGFLAWPVILLEVVGGILLIVGFKVRVAALALAGFTLLAAVLYHLVPSDQMQMTMFLKNLAVAGGLLLVTAHGAGRFAVDRA